VDVIDAERDAIPSLPIGDPALQMLGHTRSDQSQQPLAIRDDARRCELPRKPTA